jgi:hypothetical protein
VPSSASVSDAAFDRNDADEVAGALDQCLEPLRTLTCDRDVLKIDARDRQRRLGHQGADCGRQIIGDGVGRFHDEHASDGTGDVYASQQNLARQEARPLDRVGRIGGLVGPDGLFDGCPECALIGQVLACRGHLAELEPGVQDLACSVACRTEDLVASR